MNMITPCPFCGAQPDYLQSESPSKSWIACDNKQCGIKPSTPYCEMWEQALAIWNKRK